MDINSLRRRTSPNLFAFRIKTKLAVFKDRYLTFSNIFKIIFPFLFTLALLPFACGYIVDASYKRRIITGSQNLPTEIRTISFVFYYNDIFNNPEKLKTLAKQVVSLYSIKRVNAVYIFAIGDAGGSNSLPSQEQIQPYFKDIGQNNLFVNLSTKDPKSVCLAMKNTYSLNKTIILSYTDFLPRLNYACNAMEIYTVGYSPAEILSNNDENNIIKTFRDIIKINFNI